MRKKKNVLVFLPGMMCTKKLFGEVQNFPFFSSFTHCYITYKGSSIEEMAKNALTEVAKVSTESFVAIGLSMGGIVLMEMLRIAPSRVCAAIFADTNCNAELPARAGLREKEIEEVEARGLQEFVVEEMKPKYFSPALNGAHKASIQRLVVEMANTLGTAAFASQSIALREREGYENLLADIIGTKVLFLFGEDDKLCSPEKHLYMHELVANSELVGIAKAGHLSCLENPQDFYSQVELFLRASVNCR